MPCGIGCASGEGVLAKRYPDVDMHCCMLCCSSSMPLARFFSWRSYCCGSIVNASVASVMALVGKYLAIPVREEMGWGWASAATTA